MHYLSSLTRPLSSCNLLRGHASNTFCCRLPVGGLHSVSINMSSGDSSSNDKLFKNDKQAELYAKFRPRYSDSVFGKVVGYCREQSPSLKLAIDVGCGSGQSTVPLAKHFEKVIGIDVSEQQIANAPKDISNLEFLVSRAEDFSFAKDSSADLVAVAQAFHWLDQERFYKEVDRVLRPCGSLILYGYGICQLTHPEANKCFNHLYNEVLPPYWASGRKMVEQKYSSVNLPYPGWIRDDSLTLNTECTIDDFVGYLGSWSGVQTLQKENPQTDFLEETRQKFHKCFPESGLDEPGLNKVNVVWPVFMLMGRKQ